MNARCSGCGCSGVPSPSRVTMRWPTALTAGNTQERMALPSRCTVQAPHWPRPQPKRGPCKPRSLRNAYSSGIVGSSMVSRAVLPLTSSVMDCDVILSPLFAPGTRLVWRSALEQSRFKCGKPCLRDLHIVVRRIEARADAADHLTIDDDRQASLHRDEVTCRDQCDTTVIDGVLERLARFLEQSSRASLSRRKLN